MSNESILSYCCDTNRNIYDPQDEASMSEGDPENTEEWPLQLQIRSSSTINDTHGKSSQPKKKASSNHRLGENPTSAHTQSHASSSSYQEKPRSNNNYSRTQGTASTSAIPSQRKATGDGHNSYQVCRDHDHRM